MMNKNKKKKSDINFNKKILNQDFQKLQREHQQNTKKRNTIMSKSRELIKESKKVIYSIHRNEIIQAKNSIKKVEQELLNLKKKYALNELESANLYSGALQEYVEAKTFLDFMLRGNISSSSKLKINFHDYLCGLADLTGELGRHAVICATNNDFNKVKEIKEFVEYLYGQFLQFNFSNGELRKKYDAIKWNLNKIEGILYDYSIKKKN